MKFLCDRCKTRYSIADERVRGKILKIRCKNCSNVITVREGMPEPEPEPAAVAPEARRGARPTDHAPNVMVAAKSPLQQAFAQVMTATPPAPQQLEEEWYVSLDGDQQGPFSLPQAQAWVTARAADDELYCWCEGFDDWLPVEKVSHFRGLRGGGRTSGTSTSSGPTGRRPGGAGTTPAPVVGASKAAAKPASAAPSPTPPSTPPEDEPRPLFAATLAKLEAEVASDAAAAAAPAPRNGSSTATPPATSPAARAAASLPPPRPATSPPSSSPIRASGGAGLGTLPARPAATTAAPPIPLVGASPASARPAPATGAPKPAGALFDRSEDTGASADVPELEPEPDLEPSPSLTAPRAAAAPATDDAHGGFDDDLAIGEVSRVFRLGDIAAAATAKRAAPGDAAPVARPTRAATAVGRGSGAQAALGEPSALAQAATAALRDEHAAHDALPEGEAAGAAVFVPPPAPARRSHTVVYAIVGVSLLAIIALVIVFAVGGGTEDEGGQVGGGGDFGDLGRTIDDPRFIGRGSGAATGTAGTDGTRPGTARGTGKRPGTGASTSGGTQTGTQAGTGKTEVVIGADGRPLEELTPDDVIAVAAKMSSGTQRCYNRALKDDPFLKVSSIKALISVDRAGKVKSVTLDSLSGHALGQCLIAAIQRWPFRASTGGIDTQITLKFERGGM